MICKYNGAMTMAFALRSPTMARIRIGFDWLFSSMPYGPKWKKHRVLFHQHFHADSLPMVLPLISKEVNTLLCNLADTPDNLFHHVRRYIAVANNRLSVLIQKSALIGLPLPLS